MCQCHTKYNLTEPDMLCVWFIMLEAGANLAKAINKTKDIVGWCSPSLHTALLIDSTRILLSSNISPALMNALASFVHGQFESW